MRDFIDHLGSHVGGSATECVDIFIAPVH
jgi:hypothetical protein